MKKHNAAAGEYDNNLRKIQKGNVGIIKTF